MDDKFHSLHDGYRIVMLRLIMLPGPYLLVHSSINELGLYQSLALLITSSCLESKIVLELNNISVVRDIPNIFSEVLPGCSLTVMLRS